LWLSGRRGIRTPCCFPRVSRGEVKAAQKAAHGAGGGGRRGGRGRGHGAWGRRDGRRTGWARPRAHGATWRLPGPVVRGQRAAVLGGHGSSLTRTHALGPTERLAEAIEFVSGGCHRCHRYQNCLCMLATEPPARVVGLPARVDPAARLGLRSCRRIDRCAGHAPSALRKPTLVNRCQWI
jgi:hypothetical protein